MLAFFTLAGRIRAFEVEGRVQVFSFPMLGRLALFAVPSILQQSFVAVGNLAIQGLINGYGPSVIAGFSSALKLNAFAITCFNTVSGAYRPILPKISARASMKEYLMGSEPPYFCFFCSSLRLHCSFISSRLRCWE